MATDWPGYFPNGPATARLLIEADADPNADTGGDRPETPLHWAASIDDADVADVLIDGGADLERPVGSIGTPLDNAIGYGCWNVARLLVQRSARVGKLWHAAALGIMPRVEELLAATPTPAPDDVTAAFDGDDGRVSGTVTLIRDGDAVIIVDPGMVADRDALLAALRAHGPAPEDVTEAFWPACHGGQRRDQTALQAARELGTQRDSLIAWLQDHLRST